MPNLLFKNILKIFGIFSVGIFLSAAVHKCDAQSKDFHARVVTALQKYGVTQLAVPVSFEKDLKAFEAANIEIMLYEPLNISPQFFTFHQYDFALIDSSLVDKPDGLV